MIHLGEKNFLHSYFSAHDISLAIHGFRSCFHFFILVIGLAYSAFQPLFLNFEVWSFIYVTSATILTLDALVLIFAKHFKYWRALYFIDALFIALILYKTGYVFFHYLYLMWMVSILLAGFQFRFQGALQQCVWVSILLTWVNLLSPYFEKMNGQLFAINVSFLFLLSAIAGVIGHHNNVFQQVFQWIRLETQELVTEWNRLYGSDEVQTGFQETDTSRILGDNALNKFLKNHLSQLVQHSDAEFETLDVNHLVEDITHQLSNKMGLTKENFKLSLKSSNKIFGQKENLKISLFSIIHLLTSSSDELKKLFLSTYDSNGWVTIKIKSQQNDIKNPLWLFNSFSHLFFIHKILNDHKGRIYADKEDCSVIIQFPLDQKTKTFTHNAQSVS